MAESGTLFLSRQSVLQFKNTASTGKEHSMPLFKTQAELMQESRYTKSKKSGFNVSSVYVLKSDMECSFPVDVVVWLARSRIVYDPQFKNTNCPKAILIHIHTFLARWIDINQTRLIYAPRPTEVHNKSYFLVPIWELRICTLCTSVQVYNIQSIYKCP